MSAATWLGLSEEAARLEVEGRTDEAIRVLIHVCALAPEEAGPMLRLARLYEETGRDGDARVWLERTLAANSKQPEVWLRLGLLELRHGRPADAVAKLEQALSGEAEAPWAAYHLGLAHLASGERGAARRALETAAGLRAEFTECRLALAALALQEGALEESEGHERALQAWGRSCAVLSFRLAQAWQDAGDDVRARAHYARAIEADPSLALGYFEP